MGFDLIPAELRERAQWIVWRYAVVAGRQTKIPIDAKSGNPASVTAPHTWTDFYSANASLSHPGIAGLGFVFTHNDEFGGIDIDDAADKYKPEQLAEVQTLQANVYQAFSGTYAEYSPSGRGLHMIGKFKVPTGKRRKSVEIYSAERFFTMTGNVYLPNPVVDVQLQADWLWRELGGADNSAQLLDFDVSAAETDPDLAVYERACAAVNGQKFFDLWNGNFGAYYQSQSEADFALVDMLAFYSHAPSQIERMFLGSALGQRDKAKRQNYVMPMIKKSFDRLPPPLNMDVIRASMDAQFAPPPQPGERTGETFVTAEGEIIEGVAPPAAPAGDNPYMRDVPGLLGQIAYWIYQASPRPVPEISLAGAIGLMAGICGRGWNVSGTGLNTYIMLLAGTGRGKEAIHDGISKLMTEVASIGPNGGGCPGALEFIGPGDIASGQALVKYLDKQSRSFVTVQGEFDLTLKSFTQKHANAALLKLKQILLQAYSRSGRGKVLQPTIYSEREKNTAAIASPAFTLIGEGTPERFYGLLDESLVADGLLPRFTLIHYDGDRVRRNDGHVGAMPAPQLVKAVAALCGQSLMLNQSQNVIDVQLDQEAQALLDAYDQHIDDLINSAHNDTIEQIWNRAHLKALKLAALVAVGVNPTQPIITAYAAKYAMDIVNYDTRRLVAKFAAGDVGDSESKQTNDLRGVLRRYFQAPVTEASKWQSTDLMMKDKVIPKRMLQMRTNNMGSYKNDRLGATNALNKTIQSLTEAGILQQVGPMQATQYAPAGAKLYVVLDPDWLKDAAG